MRVFGNYSQNRRKPQKTEIILVLLLIFGVSFLTDSRRRGIEQETIFLINQESVQQINTRRSYYSDKLLGKIFENKLIFFLDKYKNNLFQELDLNYYFFANHPRERAGVTEKEIFSWYWLPIFLVGFFRSLKNSFFGHNLIFICAVGIFGIFNQFDSYILFLTPLLTFNIYLGLRRLIFR